MKLSPALPRTVPLLPALRLILLTAAAVGLASCSTSEKLQPTPLPSPGTGFAAAQISGQYVGSFTFGSAFPERAGETVGFLLTLQQAPGSSEISGVIQEDKAGFGRARRGCLWADVHGTCVREGDVIHLRFTKKYRHFKHPVENYLGSLPAGSSLLTGIWYDAETSTGSGVFQVTGLRVN